MPVPLPYELCGATRKAQSDMLQSRVFALPDLKAVLKELLNVFVSRLGLGKRTSSCRDVLHAAKDKDPARPATRIIAEQIPLTRNAREVPGLNCPFFKGFGIELLVPELHDLFVPDSLGYLRKNRRIR